MARTILNNQPARAISQVPDGEVVKIVGRVRALQRVLTAPLGGRECVYFEAVLFDAAPQSGPKKTKRRRAHIRDREIVDFVLEDATGEAVIRTGDVQVLLADDRHDADWRDRPEDLEALLALHHVRGSVSPSNVSQGIIAIGERIAVVGEAAWTAASESAGPYRARQKLLELSTASAHPLILSDDPETFG